eukprot:1138647-Pelagomonas_calceolata.AAC.2
MTTKPTKSSRLRALTELPAMRARGAVRATCCACTSGEHGHYMLKGMQIFDEGCTNPRSAMLDGKVVLPLLTRDSQNHAQQWSRW